MSFWQRLAIRAKQASYLTAATITAAFAVPVALNIYLHQEDTRHANSELAMLRANAVANSVAHSLDQAITAISVVCDSFSLGNAETFSRTSANVLHILGASTQLEIKPEGAPALLIAANRAPPGQLMHGGLAMSGNWQSPTPLGNPQISVRSQLLVVTQAMVNRSPEGRTRFWGYVTVSQPFSALAKTAQLNQLASEAFAIRVKYQTSSTTPDELLFDTFPEGASSLAHKTISLPGAARMQFEVTQAAPLKWPMGDLGLLIISTLSLFTLVVMALHRPAALQQRIRVANQLLEDEKLALKREINERVEAEKMLERSHRLLDSIFEHIPGMIVLKRASDRRIVRVNRSGEEIFGRSRQALVGRSNDEIYAPALALRLNQSDERVLQSPEPIELPVEQYLMPGSQPRWISIRKMALTGESRQPEYILEFGRDVTEQEQLDLRLREHLHFLEQLIDAIPSPLFFKDPKGRYLSVNQAFERYIGIDRTSLTGKTVFDISPQNLARTYHRADMDLLAAGGSQTYESSVVDSDGRHRDVIFHKAVFHQSDGDKGGIVGIVLDITERKLAERQVARLNRFLTVLSDVNECIVRTHSIDDLLKNVAKILCESGSFPLAWIQLSDDDHLLMCERCRDDEDLIRKLLRHADLRSQDVAPAPYFGSLQGNHDHASLDDTGGRNLHSLARLPVHSNDKAIGWIGLIDGNEAGFSDQEKQLLEDLASNVSQALERIDAEQQKQATLEQLQLAARVFANSAEGIMITDANNRILLVNNTFSTVTGYEPGEVIGQNPRLLSSGRQGPVFYNAMWTSLQESGEWHGEIENRRKDGKLYPEWLNISVVRQPDGSISNYIAVFSDLTNRKEIEKRIQFLSHFDTLTALPNRSHFHETLSHSLVALQGRHTKLALLTLDLDRFKLINDSLGHAAGDRILIEAATRLKNSITSGDKLCRLGGDEFAIILNHIESNGDAAALAVVCQTRLRKAIQFEGHEIHLSASIGISIFPDDADTVEGLIGCADSAMYAAIEQGGNTFRFFQQEMNARSAERMRIESRLHHALERGELSVFFQPLVSARTGRIAGAEALLRWHNEELGSVSPSVFVPLLEDTQLIRNVGKWVLRKSCLENKRWRNRTGSEMFVAVNLSAVQLADDNLLNDIREILAETGCDPRYLEIELTESSIMHDSELGIRTLNRLKDLGVRLSIDDFGTGYSSLSYLNQFPIDTLKIDRSFVMNSVVDPNFQAIIKAIVAMGHTLGFEIIAEGVEEIAQLELLRDNAVDLLQGYHFSRPIPATEFEELITRTPSYPMPERVIKTTSQLIPLSGGRR
ncbi:MAG: diguanylate cyclase/phosphodiesterase with and sensor(s) [Proteobacteria bacterium]|nr:diguanylate cyclase/phosphodiesterase with and sensor(s) [Pseudomonadota bacterium]